MKINKIYLIIILIGVLSRFFWLDSVPPGISHDEVDPIITSLSYIYRGSDFLGNTLPYSLITKQVNSSDDTFLSIYYSPMYFLFGSSIGNLRIPSVIVNILTIIVLSIAVTKLSKSKMAGLFFSILLLYSPWSLAYSRMLIQAPLALLFISTSLALSQFNRLKHWICSSIFLFLSFLTYFGAKPVSMLLSVIIPVIGLSTNYKNRISNQVSFVVVFLSLTSIYMFGSMSIKNSTLLSRFNEQKLFNISSENVNRDRRLTIENNFREIFSNKLTLKLKELSSDSLKVFDVNMLFASGDTDPNFRFGDHGLFYVMDLPLLLLGTGSLLSGIGLFAALMVIIGMIPGMIHVNSNAFLNRDFLLFPGIILFIALGVKRIVSIRSKMINHLLLVGYIASVVNFYYFYFFRYPITSSDQSFLSERLVSNYIIKLGKPVYVIASEPFSIVQQIMLQNFIKNHSYSSLGFNNGNITINNITISNDCSIITPGTTLVIDLKTKCNEKFSGSHFSIQNPEDAGAIWDIYNDTLCDSKSLFQWKRYHNRIDYNIEKMDSLNFCSTWIFKS